MIVKAVVEKLETADGLVRFAHAHIGKVYLVDVATIRRGQTLVHYHDDDVAPLLHEKDIIWTVDGFWLPLDCLKLCV